MGISQHYPYIFPNKDPHNPSIIPIYPLGSLGYPLFEKPPYVNGSWRSIQRLRLLGVKPLGYHRPKTCKIPQNSFLSTLHGQFANRCKILGATTEMGAPLAPTVQKISCAQATLSPPNLGVQVFAS